MEKTEVKTKLTKFERAFVEAIHQQFWIARDQDGELYLYFYKPEKHRKYCYWISPDDNDGAELKEDMFPFITWESEKAWSRDDLLALEVDE